MAIDLERAGEMKKVRFTRLESWDVEGYEVAWLKFGGGGPDGSTFSGKELYCECDFVDKNAPPAICEHKKVVRKRFREEAQNLYHEEWVRMGPEEAVLDIFRRARAKERLFEHHDGVIYVQEVAKLLALPERAIWGLCDRLFADEKLDLYGAILIPYVRRFRFPKELQNMMAYMIEEPLDPSEAGDCFLEEIEGAINGYTQFKHGKDAFYEENYPYIAPHHLLVFGLNWVATAISRAENVFEAREDLRPLEHGYIARELEGLAKRLRKLARKINLHIVMTAAEPFEIIFAGSKRQCEAFHKSLPPKKRKRYVVKPESYLG